MRASTARISAAGERSGRPAARRISLTPSPTASSGSTPKSRRIQKLERKTPCGRAFCAFAPCTRRPWPGSFLSDADTSMSVPWSSPTCRGRPPPRHYQAPRPSPSRGVPLRLVAELRATTPSPDRQPLAFVCFSVRRLVMPATSLEPIAGFEPATCALRKHCSTTELNRRNGGENTRGARLVKGPAAWRIAEGGPRLFC